MKHIKQDRQNNCGQTCVAIITGKTIKDIEEVVGKKGKTRTKDLIKGLNEFGVQTKTDKLKVVPKNTGYEFPVLAIARMKSPKLSHWIVLKTTPKYRWVYDPSLEERMEAKKYFGEFIKQFEFRVTSLLVVK